MFLPLTLLPKQMFSSCGSNTAHLYTKWILLALMMSKNGICPSAFLPDFSSLHFPVCLILTENRRVYPDRNKFTGSQEQHCWETWINQILFYFQVPELQILVHYVKVYPLLCEVRLACVSLQQRQRTWS